MPKKTTLTDALATAAHGAGSAKLSTTEPSHAPGARSPHAKPSRVGRINVTGYFDPTVRASFRLIQAKYPDRTQQDLVAEALNDLFAKYNVPQTASL